MKTMLNVEVFFGNVTELVTFAKTGSPTAGESAMSSPALTLLGSAYHRWILGESRDIKRNSVEGSPPF